MCFKILKIILMAALVFVFLYQMYDTGWRLAVCSLDILLLSPNLRRLHFLGKV